jgi:hypothetical protein
VASWWIPDDVVFVDEIPHTATGKVRMVSSRCLTPMEIYPLHEATSAHCVILIHCLLCVRVLEGV